MKKALIVIIFLAASLLTIRGNFYTGSNTDESVPVSNEAYREIKGTIKRGFCRYL